jgi:hypothetical protein
LTSCSNLLFCCSSFSKCSFFSVNDALKFSNVGFKTNPLEKTIAWVLMVWPHGVRGLL